MRSSFIISSSETFPIMEAVSTALIRGLEYTASNFMSPMPALASLACCLPMSLRGSFIRPCIIFPLFRFVCPCLVNQIFIAYPLFVHSPLYKITGSDCNLQLEPVVIRREKSSEIIPLQFQLYFFLYWLFSLRITVPSMFFRLLNR